MAEQRLRGLDYSEDECGVDFLDDDEMDSDVDSRVPECVSLDSETDEPVGEKPKAAAIARARKVPVNTSPQPSRRRDEKTLRRKSTMERISEFKGEQLVVRDGSLFCNACRCFVSEKKSIVAAHVKSQKHAIAKTRRDQEKGREQLIKEGLAAMDKSARQAGETIPLEERAYRVLVVQTLLREGIPLAKVEGMRSLLERDSYRLTSRSHLAELIPFILSEERHRIKKEIRDCDIGVIFDGTTRLGEAIAIVVRYVHDWTPHQLLVRLEVLERASQCSGACVHSQHLSGKDISDIRRSCPCNSPRWSSSQWSSFEAVVTILS